MTTRLLILGADGMLGHTLFFLLASWGHKVFGTVRHKETVSSAFPAFLRDSLYGDIDVFDFNSVRNIVKKCTPSIVINCIGLIRQRENGQNRWACSEINACFPHLLLTYCRMVGCRLIHYSTDCIFSGKDGRAPYHEEDEPSAYDAYGMSKFLGELTEFPALTLRTSIIGHELKTKRSFVEWFLAQKGMVHGFSKVIYSGLPASEHARILHEYVFPRNKLSGLFHVSAQPISKYNILRKIAIQYSKDIFIEKDTLHCEDKTLNSEKFNIATGYSPPMWDQLIFEMYNAHIMFQKGLQ